MTLSEELIEDRALETVEQDMLRHSDLASTLTDLIAETNTPANIALFGRWGSGKSGLANLVAAGVTAVAQHRFVRFDAFKYAEAPLRRQFLSQVAHELGIEDDKYTKGLYLSSVTSKIRVPPLEVVRTLGILALAVAGASLLWLLVLAVVAAFGDQSFGEDLVRLVNGGLALALAPATILAALLAVAGKAFSVERTSAAPSSDEEFERLFKELVRESKADKLVIFVDELDRCSAEEVVSTLETIRTFLDVESCVFIVAADQQVLEQALSREARQTTPDDPSNPYYSAGSAYLDKIFQYQIEIPTLTPRKLTNFALALVRERGGLWQEVDIESVVSVLIPTHVRSPRRVKRLLNNFVLAYRLARLRAQAGVLTSQISDRAAELAKLTCLRTEFPLFATDLAMDARLTDLVLRFVADPETEVSGQIPVRVADLARLYAAKRLPVAALVATDREDDSPKMERVLDIPAEVPPDGSPSPRDRDQESDLENADAVTDTRTTYADQLIRYLQKTEHVPGPHRDLVHLESSGADFGLDPEFADQVDTDAIDGRTSEVLAQLADVESDQARGVIRLLAHRVRESSVGIEGENAVSTLLQVLAVLDVDLTGISDEVAVALATFLDRYDLRPEDLPGALAIGISTSHSVGVQLVGAVMRRAEIETDTHLRSAVIDNAEKLRDHLEVVASAFAAAVDESEEQARSVSVSLAQQSPEVSREVITLSAEDLTARSAVSQVENGDGEKDDGPDESGFSLLEGLKVSMEIFSSANQALGAALATVILGFDTLEARNLVRGHLPELSPVKSAALTKRILVSVKKRAVPDWSGWLAHLDAEVTTALESTELLVGLVERMWAGAMGDSPPTIDDMKAAAGEVVRLSPAGLMPVSSGQVAEAVTTTLAEDPVSDGAVQKLSTALEWADHLSDVGVLDFEVAAAAAGGGIKRTFEGALPAQPTGSPLVRYFLRWLPSVLREMADVEEIKSLRSSAVGASWLGSPDKETMVLQITQRVRSLEADDPIPTTSSEIESLITAHGDAATATLIAWLDCHPEPGDVWIAVRTVAGAELGPDVRESLLSFTGRLSPPERLEVARPILHASLDQMPHQSLFHAVRFSESDELGAADELIDLLPKANNMERRERVLTLWHQLGPVRSDVKQALIDKIYLPIAEGSAGGFDLAVKNLSLIQGAREQAREEVIKRLRSAAPPDKHERLEKRLRDSGLVRRSILDRIFRSGDKN